MVTVLPLTVATAVLELVYVTVPPGALAESVKAASPTVFAANAPNVIVWFALDTVKACVTSVAAL
jgi:hypothetical protein